jgi:hypothetical protein
MAAPLLTRLAKVRVAHLAQICESHAFGILPHLGDQVSHPVHMHIVPLLVSFVKALLHVIAQHQLLGVRMEVHLLVHPLGYRVAIQVMLEQRHGHDQRHQLLPVVLDEAQQL